MDYSSFINIDVLSEEAKKELKAFYDFLIFKYKKKGNKNKPGERFKDFLSDPLEAKNFKMPNREERNER